MEISVFKDVVLICTSLTTIGFAFYTLNKWKKEHKAKMQFDCAYKCLKALYAMRDGFASVRSNFIMAHEYLPDMVMSNSLSKEQEKANTTYVLQNRLTPFQKVLNEYYSMLPEVEVIFGKDFRKLCQKVNHVVVKYKFSLNEYVQLLGATNDIEYLNEVRRDVFNVYTDPKKDKLSGDLERTIEEIEKQIYTYISL